MQSSLDTGSRPFTLEYEVAMVTIIQAPRGFTDQSIHDWESVIKHIQSDTKCCTCVGDVRSGEWTVALIIKTFNPNR